MKHYLIYKITCNVNNKIYIGKHITNDINDSYMGSGVILQYEQKLFGLDKFKKEILFDCSSKEEMDKKEAEIVNEDFIARDDVYNIKLGGEGGWDLINGNSKLKTEITRQGGITTNQRIKLWPKDIQDEYWKKITAKVQHIRSTWSKEYKDSVYSSVSKSLKEFYELHANPMFGKHHSEASRKKMSKSHNGVKNGQYGKMWICNDTTHESKTILKTESIPDGWRKGRFCK